MGLFRTAVENVQWTTTGTVTVRGERPSTAALQRTVAPSSWVVVVNAAVPRSVTRRIALRPRRPDTVTHHDSASRSGRAGSGEATGGSSWTLTVGGGWPPTATQRRRPGRPSTYTRLAGLTVGGADRDPASASRNAEMFSSSLIVNRSISATQTENILSKCASSTKHKWADGGQ